MNILTMMWKNLWGGSRTMRFPAGPKVTERFRGLVQFNPELCTGCAVCKFRCTSRAITYKAGKGEFYWSYDPGQCTFCGRCVEGCKAGALIQDSETPPVYTTLGELKKSYTIARKAPAPKTIPKAVHSPAPVPPVADAEAAQPAAGGPQ